MMKSPYPPYIDTNSFGFLHMLFELGEGFKPIKDLLGYRIDLDSLANLDVIEFDDSKSAVKITEVGVKIISGWCCVYGLVDPITGRIRYVGQTTNLGHRTNAHLSASGNSLKDQWVQELRAKGLRPIVVVLYECKSSTDDLYALEAYFIQLMRSGGSNLLNQASLQITKKHSKRLAHQLELPILKELIRY